MHEKTGETFWSLNRIYSVVCCINNDHMVLHYCNVKTERSQFSHRLF